MPDREPTALAQQVAFEVERFAREHARTVVDAEDTSAQIVGLRRSNVLAPDRARHQHLPAARRRHEGMRRPAQHVVRHARDETPRVPRAQEPTADVRERAAHARVDRGRLQHLLQHAEHPGFGRVAARIDHLEHVADDIEHEPRLQRRRAGILDCKKSAAERIKMHYHGRAGVSLGDLRSASLWVARRQGDSRGVPVGIQHAVVGVERPLQPRCELRACVRAVLEVRANEPSERVVVHERRDPALAHFRFGFVRERRREVWLVLLHGVALVVHDDTAAADPARVGERVDGRAIHQQQAAVGVALRCVSRPGGRLL